jgi:hypothetical protein
LFYSAAVRKFLLLLSVCSLWLSTLSVTQANESELELVFAGLLVAAEERNGYDRKLFPHWIDEDRNGCNARYEVLIAEAIVKPAISGRCQLTGGRWFSQFDGKRIIDSRQLDVDHFVPLAEAWRSGANRWNQTQRIKFANDLDLPDALISVTASSNRSKADKDVANWMPSNRNYRCEYLVSWIKVKAKWQLTVDAVERRALEDGLIACNLIKNRTAPKLFVGSRADQPKLQPIAQRFTNCTSARAAKVTPIRRTSTPGLYELNQHLDRDKDGIACE